MNYTLSFTVQFDHWHRTDPFVYEAAPFVIKDYCANVTYEGDPYLKKKRTDNFIIVGQNFDELKGDSIDDPYVIILQKNLNTDLDIFEM